MVSRAKNSKRDGDGIAIEEKIDPPPPAVAAVARLLGRQAARDPNREHPGAVVKPITPEDVDDAS